MTQRDRDRLVVLQKARLNHPLESKVDERGRVDYELAGSDRVRFCVRRARSRPCDTSAKDSAVLAMIVLKLFIELRSLDLTDARRRSPARLSRTPQPP